MKVLLPPLDGLAFAHIDAADEAAVSAIQQRHFAVLLAYYYALTIGCHRHTAHREAQALLPELFAIAADEISPRIASARDYAKRAGPAVYRHCRD